MREHIIIKMNKRGAALEVSAVILIIVTTIGILTVFDASKHIYVGDKLKKEFYDYTLCPDEINSIKEENVIIFGNVKEAEAKHYNKVIGCVQQ